MTSLDGELSRSQIKWDLGQTPLLPRTAMSNVVALSYTRKNRRIGPGMKTGAAVQVDEVMVGVIGVGRPGIIQIPTLAIH